MMMMLPNVRVRHTLANNHRYGYQGGVALFVALIMLVVISLVGIVLFRQVTAGVIIAGNLAFKEAATSAADRGTEAARGWLKAPASAAVLQGTTAADGYFPAWCYSTGWVTGTDCTSAPQQFNATSYDWDATGHSVLVTSDDGSGNKIRWVMHRLCPTNGDDSVLSCVQASMQGRCGNDQDAPPNCVWKPTYYRITTRVDGPRNTVSYVQVILY